MSDGNIFDEIRKGVIDHRDKGNEAVGIEKLLEYLNALEDEIGDGDEIDVSKEAEIERIRATFANQQAKYQWEKEASLAKYHWDKDSSLEMFKSVIASGQNSLKACMLMHAGACIAMLAFIGNLASSAETRLFIPQLAEVMLWFVVGVLVVSIAYGATYWTQHCYDNNEEGKWGVRWHVISTVLAIFSYLLFLVGGVQGYQAMTAMYVEPIAKVAPSSGEAVPVEVQEVAPPSTDASLVQVLDVVLPVDALPVEVVEVAVQFSDNVSPLKVPEAGTAAPEVISDSVKVVDEVEVIGGSSSE
jgi:hypothetical protein